MNQNSEDGYFTSKKLVFVFANSGASVTDLFRQYAHYPICYVLNEGIKVEYAPGDVIQVNVGDHITLAYHASAGNLYIPHREFFENVLPGARGLFEQGGAEVLVIDAKPDSFVCRVIKPGLIRSGDLMTIPNPSPRLMPFAEAESQVQSLRYLSSYPQIIAVAPYLAHVEHMRYLLNKAGMQAVKLYTYIQSPWQIANCRLALEAADGVCLHLNASYADYYSRQLVILASRLDKPILACAPSDIVRDDPFTRRAS